KSIEARMAIMAMTTSSSMRVNARPLRCESACSPKATRAKPYWRCAGGLTTRSLSLSSTAHLIKRRPSAFEGPDVRELTRRDRGAQGLVRPRHLSCLEHLELRAIAFPPERDIAGGQIRFDLDNVERRGRN